MVEAAVILRFRRCFSLLSHRVEMPVISKANPLLFATKSQFTEYYAPVNSDAVDRAPGTTGIQGFIQPQSNVLESEIACRRHRGGKVKNKLRNIEKRKKREQILHKISSDVKFK
ncbi:uncharacterized protein BXIN_3077 [Babesia sp. Xinjiang]|uniref:uncharacterized protein n=1 Tax=Babesia sp. Xinjiang TaxID=462227 RepID=UPI000A264368|nr:uncharacterized protein BXIN_3077 [Babesia sp. Xinjiang]ORM39329.1 hypothetical protein BXIN_3077 [Babesia sp. Xinjiang]